MNVKALFIHMKYPAARTSYTANLNGSHRKSKTKRVWWFLCYVEDTTKDTDYHQSVKSSSRLY